MSDQETEFWQKAQDLFARAIELPDSERAGFVETQSVGDEGLRTEVLSLLEAFEPGQDELEKSPVSLASDADESYTVPADLVPGYEILSELHRGGQGVVYKAIQLGTGRYVALKFLLTGPLAGEAERRRFAREVNVTSQFDHPGIVPVFDSGVAQHQRYFVMPFVEGRRLNDYVSGQDRSTDELLRLFAEICDAVGHAHCKQVVHRDLKPSNIVVSDDGKPRVLDFGLAKTGDSGDATTLSVTGHVMGTLNYMSPEQAIGANRTIDPRSDVYSLGVMLYELLAGRIPYDLDGSLAENLTTIQNADHKPLKRNVASVPDELNRIVERSLAREPAERYADATELQADVRRFLDDGPKARATKNVRWPRLRLAGATIAGVLLLALCIWLAFDHKPPAESVPKPLAPLKAGQLYSNADLESQLTAMKNLTRREVEPAELLAQFRSRFGSLTVKSFDDSLTNQRRSDLQFMLKARQLLADKPGVESIAKYQQGLAQQTQQQRPSGLAQEIVEAILAAAIAAH